MDWAINALLNEEIINGLDILVLASVGCADNSTDSNCVLINQVDGLLWIDYETLGCAENILLFNVEVPVIETLAEA
jgi:hypothetical protein